MPQIDPQLRGTGGLSAKSWEYAAAFADSLGPLPSSVTTLVRFLLADHERDPHQLSRDSEFLLGRFLKCRSFLAPYYHAVRMLRPDVVPPQDEPIFKEDFFRAFSGPEHAFFISLIFLHRQAKRMSEEGLFDTATSWLQRGINIGWLIGKTLKAIGPDAGLLVGSYRWLGVLPFLKHDPEGFKLYTRHLRTKEFSSTDITFETDRWECNSTQVGIMLMQRMGFGIPRLTSLMRATTTISTISPAEPTERAFRAAEVWVRYLLERRTVPSIPLPPAYYLSAQDLESIISRLDDDLPKRDRAWLSATKMDISPEETPQLFVDDQDGEVLPSRDRIENTPESEVFAALDENENDVDSILD